MANEQNLSPRKLTSEEAARIGRIGGQQSVKSRRRKKDMRAKMKLLLSLPAADNDQAELSAMGIDSEDMDNEMVLVKSLFLSAAAGDTKAFDRIMDLLGKSVAREELAMKKEEQKRDKEQADIEDLSPLADKLKL